MSSITAPYPRRNSKSQVIASRKLTFSDEDDEQDGALRSEKMQTLAGDNDGDEDDDSEDLDRFEDDGFIVYDAEEEEGDEQDRNEEQNRRKKRKKRSLKNIVLEEEDLELIQENAALGIVPFKDRSQSFKRLKQAEKGSEVVEFTGYYEDSIFDDVYGEEEDLDDNEEDDMGTFIVEDEIDVKRAPLRYWNPVENKSEQALVVYTSPSKQALKEAGFIIGDVDEILNQQKQALAMVVEPDKPNEFEPLFLIDKYITERDDYAREVDLPERMQMFEEISGPPPVDEMSIEEESDWILNQLAKIVISSLCTKRTQEGVDEGLGPLSKIKKEDIMRFLELHHVKKYDIPFICMYRKEQCLSLLDDIELDGEQDGANDSLEQSCRLKWHKILWTVKDLDNKWLLLHKRKTAMQAYYKKYYDDIIDEGCKTICDDVELSLYKPQPFESIKESLKNAELEEEINDVEMKFSLLFHLDDDMVDGNFKRPNQKSLYANCRNAGLWKLASQFGYNSEQLGLLISLEKVEMELPEDPDAAPEEMALKFIYPMFENPEAVLKGARHMAAVDISHEQCIRKYVRSVFMDKAAVSTSPTSKGNKVVDSLHQFAAVKWLRNKPLTKFKDAQWLLIQKAEEEKLLQVTIRLLENDLNNLLDVFSHFYLRDGVGTSIELWNEQCKLVLQDSISNFLLPAMEKEARVALTAGAKKWLLLEYGKQLWKKVSIAPYAHKENIPPRVMACCWGPGNPATTFVMLDSSGDLLEVLEARSLHLRSQDVNTQQRKQNDQLRLLKFIRNHQPNVIVIGAANVSCVEVKDKIKEIVSKIEESRGTDQDVDKINVVYGDETLPQLYESSQISAVQLHRQPGIVKRAVALGRYIQSPLAMVANLCGTGKEIVSWKLSPMDHYLIPDEKYEMIEQVMVDVTNQVGLDINLALRHVWYLPLLQFVSGLGPQKAVFLRKKMVEGRAICSRKGLTSFGLSTKVVFHNAVGFLCVRHTGFLCPCAAIEPLDSTRIHPESYVLAENLAKAICNNDMLEDPLKSLKKNLGLLREFNIDDYAESYEIEEGETMRETLPHIKKELLHGFLDPRAPYKEPTPEEEFKMITGKYGEIFAEGRILQAKVQQVQSQRAFFTLDSGLTGILAKEDFSDEGGDFGLHDKLRGVYTLSCKIKDIDRGSYQVHLTCKDTDMKTGSDISDADPYYCESENISVSQKETACKGKEFTKQNFMPRSINHSKFMNMNMDHAVEFLSDKHTGDCVFRPSPRGPSHLILTMKVFDDLFAHEDIIEGGKNMMSFTGLLQLGTSLTIGHDTFKDLNEIMDQYVSPVVKHMEEIQRSRKFKKGSQAEVDELLKSEEPDDPTAIVYALRLSYEHPGTFLLSYIKNGNLHHEHVGLLPSGFIFRKRVFKNIEDLLVSFQNNIHDIQPNSTAEKNPSLSNSPVQSKGKSISRDANDCKKGGNEIEWVSSPKNEGKDPLDGGKTSGGNWCSDNSNKNSGWSKVCDDDKGGGAKTGNGILGAYPGRGRGRGRGFGDDNKNNETGWGGAKQNVIGADQNNGSKNENSWVGSGWNSSGGNQGEQKPPSWGQKQESLHHGDDEKKENSWGGNGGRWNASGGNQGGQQKPSWGQKQESFHGGDDEKKENSWGGNGSCWNASGGNQGGQQKPSWGQKQETFHGGDDEKKENWGSGERGNGWSSRNDNAGGGWGGNEGTWRGDRGRSSNYSRGRGQRNDFDNYGNSNGGRETGWGSGWGRNKENEGGGWPGGNNSPGGGPKGGRDNCGRGRGQRNGDDSGGNFGVWNSNNDKTDGSWSANGGNWQANRISQDESGSLNRGRGRGGGRARGNRQDYQNNGDDDSNRGNCDGGRGRGNWGGDGNSSGRGRGNWGGNANSGKEDWGGGGGGGNGGFGGGGRSRGGCGKADGGYNEGADSGSRRGRGGCGNWICGGDDWSSGRGGNGRSGGGGRGGRGYWGSNGNDGAEGCGRRGRGGRGNWSNNQNSGGNKWSSGGGNWGGGGDGW